MTILHSVCRAAWMGVGAIVAVTLLTSAAQAQQTYASPEEAAASLVAAVKVGTSSAILKVLGRDAEDIVESGDEVADAEAFGVFEQLLADGGGAADDGVGAVFDLFARFDGHQKL